jgi:hypothetical protein
MNKLTTLSLAGTLSLGLGAWTTIPAGMGIADFVAPDNFTVTLQPAGGSAASGTAQFEGGAGEATMTIEVHGVGANAPVAVSFVAGSCASPGAVKTTLGSMQTDSSGAAAGRVALSQPLDSLLATPTAVLVRSAADASGQSLLCGDVTASDAPSAPSAPSAPDVPSAPSAPSTPSAPDAPSAPSAPDAPTAPGAPTDPGAPTTPGAPAGPGAPTTPGGN